MGMVVGAHLAPTQSDIRVVVWFAWCFVRLVVASNRIALRDSRGSGAALPALYASGVRYGRKPPGAPQYVKSVFELLRDGWGDCADLCALRLAELHEAGEMKADLKFSQPSPLDDVHVTIVRADKSEEDPSRTLGMV